MEQSPEQAAVDRIDAALARIERALARGKAERRDLEGRHERLKATVSETIGAIDSLIAEVSE